jgi:hypothetical protein
VSIESSESKTELADWSNAMGDWASWAHYIRPVLWGVSVAWGLILLMPREAESRLAWLVGILVAIALAI